MPNEEAKSYLEQATSAVQTGQFERALSLIEQCLTLDPQNYEGLIVRGIAQSQTNQPDAATDSFREAIRIQPTTTKGHYNLAVHLYGIGRTQSALEAVRKAVEFDSSHLAAQDLRQKIEIELGMAAKPMDAAAEEMQTIESPSQPAGDHTDPYYREGYDSDPDVHSIPFVERMGNAWIWIGAGLAILPIFLFGISYLMAPGQFQEMLAGRQPQQQIQPPIGSMVIIGLSILTAFSSLTWMIMDILDRRTSLVWLIPFAVCCCITSGCLPGVVMGLYIAVGRK